ncbi:MAG: hypothetical protein PVG30_09020 [Gammaproteobacteria bacterium]|jgi:tetratricopeptide (TPR) repeat protein
MLAQCYDELQQYSSAIRGYLNTRKILLTKSNQEHQYYGITTTIFQTNMALGTCYVESKDFKNAIIYLQNALKSTKDPKETAYAKEMLQLTYLKCGDNFFKYAEENEETYGYENICKYYNEAIKYYNKSISINIINKNHIRSYEKKAYAYFQLQNFFEAKKCLEKTISLLPKNAKQNRILLLEKLKTIENRLKTQSFPKEDHHDKNGKNNFKIK